MSPIYGARWEDYIVDIEAQCREVLPPLSDREGDAIWVWRRTRALRESANGDPTVLNDFIQFCHENRITEVYVYAGDIHATRDQFPALLAQLHANGIRVEALMGEGTWLMPTGGWDHPDNNLSGTHDRSDGLATVAELLVYQEEHLPDQRFDGIHFDLEIQTLIRDNGLPWTDPDTGDPIGDEQRIRYYLEFVDAVLALRDAFEFGPEDLPFNWDMPMHMDRPGFAAMPWPPEAPTKPGWQHLFQRFDRITFMTYADRAHYITGGMEAELAYLDALQRSPRQSPPPVRFSLEFQRQFKHHILENIGFANEEYQSLANLRNNVESVLHNRDYFVGWANHAFDNI